MTDHIPLFILIAIVLLVLDYYIYSGIIKGLRLRKGSVKAFGFFFWCFSFFLIAGLFLSIFVKLSVGIRAAILMAFFLTFAGKVLFLPFLFGDDIRRLFVWRTRTKAAVEIAEKSSPTFTAIPRSEFLVKAGLLAGSLPIATLAYGTLKGVYDYRLRKQVLYLPNLPKQFDGLTLGQLSDIHAGSFSDHKAVAVGVELLMREKPDLIFFTGDLVNDRAYEMYGYQDIFSKVKAPLGVFSSLGNHDYGDYSYRWLPGAKEKNHADLIQTHKNMGWNLLQNENRRIKVGGEEIGILGCENWGTLSRFPKYGRMDLTTKDTADLPVKLLLSHDPSHWDAEIRPKYGNIDVTFAGHTHGMQFGVRTKEIQWSPIEYVYEEWAGLYKKGAQQLYVNVGYGFLGYPGRVGILPEVTIFELRSSLEPDF
ncbi:metallophosphoesterase [Mucilaginibacter ginkgonis]|uniref:Metallophosphoesterase n=1 Tax=Mucilaginibacter ginkgonis TaxID=2682091 RepID=A0A7T7F7X7_9SPHI|nr:metallophosphoesterase [Mucilaginibacter ginkgonis]QQL48304.1 metallophosphoesterase [Mucilaginibacter ginkgonis]